MLQNFSDQNTHRSKHVSSLGAFRLMCSTQAYSKIKYLTRSFLMSNWTTETKTGKVFQLCRWLFKGLHWLEIQILVTSTKAVCKESCNKKLEGSLKDFTIGLSTDLIEKDLGNAIELYGDQRSGSPLSVLELLSNSKPIWIVLSSAKYWNKNRKFRFQFRSENR